MSMLRPHKVQVTLTGTGIDNDIQGLPEMGDSGFLYAVTARCSADGGTAPTGVLYVGDQTLTLPPVEGDLDFESTSTAYTTSATTADLRETFNEPFPYKVQNDSDMSIAFDATAAVGAWSLVVDLFIAISGD